MVNSEAYLARGTVAQVLKQRDVKKHWRHKKGHFAFVEALSTCPTNWRTNAAATWSFLEQEMSSYYSVGAIRP